VLLLYNRGVLNTCFTENIVKRTIQVDKFLLFAAILLAVGFVIRLGADFYLIQTGASSSPFWLFLVVRGVVFLVPALICYLISKWMTKRDQNK